MDKNYFPHGLSTPFGFWKMLWIKIVGKREVSHNMGFRIVGYRYKDCFHVTSIKALPEDMIKDFEEKGFKIIPSPNVREKP